MNFLITGCDRGIGLGLAQHLLERSNGRVIATCRDLEGANDIKQLQKQYGEDRLIAANLDTTVDDCFEDVKAHLQRSGVNTIDVLIGNAAISTAEHPEDHALTCSRDELLQVFNTNVGGNMRLLQIFSDMLCQSNLRLAMIVSSELGSLHCASSEGGTTAYRVSKVALNMFSVLFAQDEQIKNNGCKVIVTHPGHVETYLGTAGGQQPQISVDESANALIDLIEAAASVQCSQLAERLAGKGKECQLEFEPSMNDIAQKQNLQEFIQQLKNDNKVFVNYDGSIIPW
eukprot:gene6410-7066_t